METHMIQVRLFMSKRTPTYPFLVPFLSSLCAVTIAENADRIKGWEKLSDEVKPLILRQFSKTVRYPYSTDTLRLLFGSHQRCLDTKKFVHIDVSFLIGPDITRYIYILSEKRDLSRN